MRAEFAAQPAKLPDHGKFAGSEKGRSRVGEGWVASIASTFRKVGEMKLEGVLQGPAMAATAAPRSSARSSDERSAVGRTG